VLPAAARRSLAHLRRVSRLRALVARDRGSVAGSVLRSSLSRLVQRVVRALSEVLAASLAMRSARSAAMRFSASMAARMWGWSYHSASLVRERPLASASMVRVKQESVNMRRSWSSWPRFFGWMSMRAPLSHGRKVWPSTYGAAGPVFDQNGTPRRDEAGAEVASIRGLRSILQRLRNSTFGLPPRARQDIEIGWGRAGFVCLKAILRVSPLETGWGEHAVTRCSRVSSPGLKAWPTSEQAR
jgi:hypothetical protein